MAQETCDEVHFNLTVYIVKPSSGDVSKTLNYTITFSFKFNKGFLFFLKGEKIVEFLSPIQQVNNFSVHKYRILYTVLTK